MPIASCPQCGKRKEIPSHLAGQRLRCPACRTAFTADSSPGAGPEQLAVERENEAEATGPTVLFSCSLCSDSYPVETSLAGQAIRCRTCGDFGRVSGGLKAVSAPDEDRISNVQAVPAPATVSYPAVVSPKRAGLELCRQIAVGLWIVGAILLMIALSAYRVCDSQDEQNEAIARKSESHFPRKVDRSHVYALATIGAIVLTTGGICWNIPVAPELSAAPAQSNQPTPPKKRSHNSMILRLSGGGLMLAGLLGGNSVLFIGGIICAVGGFIVGSIEDSQAG